MPDMNDGEVQTTPPGGSGSKRKKRKYAKAPMGPRSALGSYHAGGMVKGKGYHGGGKVTKGY